MPQDLISFVHLPYEKDFLFVTHLQGKAAKHFQSKVGAFPTTHGKHHSKISLNFRWCWKKKLSRNWKCPLKKTKRKGKVPFVTAEIIGNWAFPLSFHGENSHEILIFFAVHPICQIKLIYSWVRIRAEPFLTSHAPHTYNPLKDEK